MADVLRSPADFNDPADPRLYDRLEPAGLRPQDIPAILKRRKWQIIVPAAVVFLVATALAVLLPSIYRSSATVLIEEADVPRELVSSTITSYADQRLQVINQIVMASQNLIGIVNRYNLYPEARALLPINEVIEKMRKKISMDMISAQVMDPRSGRPAQANIAFSVSFEHNNPEVAQRVANDLVSLFLNENIRTRQEKTAETTSFVTAEAARMEARIADLEGKLAEQKRLHAGSLPEEREYNQQMIARADQEIRDLDRQAQSLQERQTYLEAQVAQTRPFGAYAIGDKMILSPTEQLKALRTNYISLASQYGTDHPDVVRVRKEIEALERETGDQPDATSVAKEVDRLTTEVARARERYSDEHPDVLRLQRQLEQAQRALAQAPRTPRPSAKNAEPDNPAYIQLKAQLESTRSEAKAVAAQKVATKAKLVEFEQRLAKTPIAERDYLAVKRELENAYKEYQELRAKQTAAELGQALETGRKSEKLSIIEPPVLPTDPVKPPRLAIFLLGLVLSAGAGLGTAMLAEKLDTSVRGARQLAAITGAAPLVVVPYIETKADRRRLWTTRVASVLVLLAIVGGGLAYLHFMRAPLDVLWVDLQRRIEKAWILTVK